MISINATLVLQIIHILILIFVLDRLMFRPILKVIRDRDGYVEQTKKDIVNLEKEIDRLKDERIMTEAAARTQAVLERTELKSLGLIEVEALNDQSRKEVAAIRAEAERTAEEKINQTKPALGGEAVNLADEIVERIIGRRIAS